MKRTILLGVFAFAVIASIAVVAYKRMGIFQGGSIKIAHAQATTVTCSDGSASCGEILPYNVGAVHMPNITSQCSLSGKGNYGGEYCDQNGNYGLTATQDNGSWAVPSYEAGYIPTSAMLQQYSDDPYHNYGIFPGTSIELSVNGTNGAKAWAGTAAVSAMACSCGPNDVTGNNCINQSGFTIGTADPGSEISMQAYAICKPNQNDDAGSSCVPGQTCGQWAYGSSTLVELNDTTACDTSANPNSPWIDPNNQSLGRRDYTPTADGYCTWDNAPPNPKPQVGLSVYSANVDDSDPVVSTNVMNIGDPSSTLDWSSGNEFCNGTVDACFSYSPTSGGGVVGILPPWMHVAEADTALAAGDFDPVNFQFDHTQAGKIGENNPNSGEVDFYCTDQNCKSTTTVSYDVQYTVPAPSISAGSFGLKSSVSVGQKPTLTWEPGEISNSNTSDFANSAVCITGGGFGSGTAPGSGTCFPVGQGSATDPSAVTGPTSYTLTVRGLSDVDLNSDNFASQGLTVTPTDVVLSCTVNQTSVTQGSLGQSESFNYSVSGSPAGVYTWVAPDGKHGPAAQSAYTYTTGVPGTYQILVNSSDGGSTQCPSVTINPPPSSGSISFSLTDSTKGIQAGPSDPTFSDTDYYLISVNATNIAPGTTVCINGTKNGVSTGGCTPLGTLSGTLAASSISPQPWGGWSSAFDGQWSESVTAESGPPVTSNGVEFTLAPSSSTSPTGGVSGFSCSVSAATPSVDSGGSDSISWSSSPASSHCSASWTSSTAGSGSYNATNITQDTTYSMNCTDPSSGSSVACSSASVTAVNVSLPTCGTNTASPLCSDPSELCGNGGSAGGSCIYSNSGDSSGNTSWHCSNSAGTVYCAQCPGAGYQDINGQCEQLQYSCNYGYNGTSCGGPDENCIASNGESDGNGGNCYPDLSCGGVCSVPGPVFPGSCSQTFIGEATGTPSESTWTNDEQMCSLEGEPDGSDGPDGMSVGVSGIGTQSDPWTWSCPSENTSSVSCTGFSTNVEFDGSCGSDDDNNNPQGCRSALTATSPNLCSGTVANFSGTGGWSWECEGLGPTFEDGYPVNPPRNASCSASYCSNGPSDIVISASCLPSFLQVDGTSVCSATVNGVSNSSVNWSSSAGNIDANGNFTAPATAPNSGIVTITASTDGVSATTSIVVASQPLNFVSLTSNVTPSTTDETPVILTATAGGTATGTLNYTFWWNCPAYANAANPTVAGADAACGGDPGTVAGIGAKITATSSLIVVETHVYSSGSQASFNLPSLISVANADTSGNTLETPIVIVERGSSPAAEGDVALSLANGHFECVNNSCESVTGAGKDRCSTDADCGGGSNPDVHSSCNADNDACVNIAGAGTDSCSTDVPCGDSVTQTHLSCESDSCVVVDGAGSNDCIQVGSPCTGAPSLSFSVSPISTNYGGPITATWSSTNVTSCSASSNPGESDWDGSMNISSPNGGWTLRPTPDSLGATSETYSLTCTGAGGNVTQTQTVTVGAPPPITCTDITANPSVISPPVGSTLSWSCVNATNGCTINGQPVNMTTNGANSSGSYAVNPTSTTEYDLNCEGLDQAVSSTSQVVVTVKGGGVMEINP